ncbi:MAG: tetratricopeptide repeat protein [Verrucomicrobia bacterium]|nr:tetratricopeptide repeat protein [Verrucomicrobiota bacterium]
MNARRDRPLASPSSPLRTVWLFAGVLALATLAVYSNALSVPFIFDDPSSILTNPTLATLWPPWGAFSPPPLVTVSGRPLVNFTFALNHAVSGTAPWSYHLANLAIHIAAGLLLFGIVRRTLASPSLSGRFGTSALPLAFISAALWTLHPLQTESVTYVVQRVESLMGFFYLLTVYAFVRATESQAGIRWLVVSVAACLCGMASKEVMVSAPLLVFLYDRTFVSVTFAEAWRRRRIYYAALAATWLLLASLVLATRSRGGTAGFDTDVSAWSYGLTQLRTLTTYLRLSLWPHPLVFDYGTDLVRHAADVVVPGVIIAAAIGGTIWALWRRPALGFAGVWFFAIIAPSSSIIPVATQTAAEHRMYLPLAAVLVAVTLLMFSWVGRRSIAVGLVVAGAFAVLAWQRNTVYRDELALWTDTVAKRPNNARAHYNLAEVLARTPHKADAVAHYESALQLDPNYAEAYNNLGILLKDLGRPDEAFENFGRSVRIDPGNPISQYNLGDTLAQRGRFNEAITHLETALKLQTDYPEALNSLGGALLQPVRDCAAAEARFRRGPQQPRRRSPANGPPGRGGEAIRDRGAPRPA